MPIRILLRVYRDRNDCRLFRRGLLVGSFKLAQRLPMILHTTHTILFDVCLWRGCYFILGYLMTSSRTVDKITSQLEQEENLMMVHEKNSNYAEAQVSRLKIAQLKKDLEARTLYEMEQRHKREMHDLERTNSNELTAFNALMDRKANDIQEEGNKAEAELLVKHKQELQAHRKELEGELSTTVKESSELLNLRVMQAHMVKQQSYAEAQKVKDSIQLKQKAEKQAWMAKRDEKIEISLNTLRGKQAVELANLRKRFKTLLDELITERKIEEDRLLKKHENFHKDLHSQQEKEQLSFKGEFRSKGGRDSPIRTKSSFTA